EKINKHFAQAETLLSDALTVRKLIDRHADFWSGHYPSKWKFALDNLLLTKDRKAAFIDNVNIGSRFLCYDLGWIIWPMWLHMSDAAFLQPVGSHIDYLVSVCTQLQAAQPSTLSLRDSLEEAFWLTVFERCIGALFDVVNQTKHLASSGLAEQNARREHHQQFLLALLNEVVVRLS
ncbi:MAG: hypothetical protein V1778_04130, partial [bacterium]